MASYIVDASVIIEYLITGPHTLQVQAFFEGITSTDRLIIPEFALLECTNVIWKHSRFNSMPVNDAEKLIIVLQTLKLKRVPVKRLLSQSLEIGLKNALAIYDSAYIALAVHYGYPLVTLDQPQLRAARAENVRTVSFE